MCHFALPVGSLPLTHTASGARHCVGCLLPCQNEPELESMLRGLGFNDSIVEQEINVAKHGGLFAGGFAVTFDMFSKYYNGLMERMATLREQQVRFATCGARPPWKPSLC